MKANKLNRPLLSILSAAIILTSLFTGPAVAADAVLEAVPARCVFCVRLNNLDYTLSQLDQFLAGAAPMSTAMLARMQLANLTGDPALQGLDTAGSFAFFAVPAEQQNPDADPDVLAVMLLPVRDYEAFVNLSNNVAEPDANGISKVTMASGMGGPGAPGKTINLISMKAGSFAMITKEEKAAQLVEVAKSISSGSMAGKIDADQAKLSAEMPIWAYGDIEQANTAFGPFIEKAFAEAEQGFKGMGCAPGQAMPANFSEIMKIYLDIAKAFLQQGKYASVTLKPEPAVLRIHKTLAAKPGTEMAKLLTADPTLPKENKLIAQLGDGAAINVASKVDKASMQKFSEFGMSFMKAGAAGDPNAADEMARWDQLTKDSLDSMGQILSLSVRGNPGGKPPFVAEYIVEMKDKQKYDKVFDESMELMKSGAFWKMYKKMGMDMSFDVKRSASEYNGVSIDSAKLTMKVTDTNSPQGQMIQTMYGDGFDYRMAYVDGFYMTAVGGDPDGTIKKMIDSVKAGANKQAGGELTSAMALLGDDAKGANFVGTINYIRLIGLATGFMPMPMPIPFDQIPTRSNIAFAGRGSDGKLVMDVAVPKEHVMEFVTGMQMLMQQQQQQMQQQGGPSDSSVR